MSFADDMKAFADKSSERIDKLIRGSALELFKRIVLKTPVDTGRARANWQVALDGVDMGSALLFAGEKGNGKNDEADKARREMNKSRAANAAISVATEVLNRTHPGTRKICLYNNVTYIVDLEYGSSVQARNPNGMVRISVAEWPSIVSGLAQRR